MATHPFENMLVVNTKSLLKSNAIDAMNINDHLPTFQRFLLPSRVKLKSNKIINGIKKSQVIATFYTSDGQERFYNKELHKCQFEYHRGGKMRPARPNPVDTLKVIMFQVINTL